MAIKILSGQWETLQHENRVLRDTTRKRFYGELGITPAKKVSEIDLPAEAREGIIQALIEEAVNGREGDAELKAINQLASALLTQFSPGFVNLGGFFEGFDFQTNHPEKLREFFLSDDMHSYEISKVE